MAGGGVIMPDPMMMIGFVSVVLLFLLFTELRPFAMWGLLLLPLLGWLWRRSAFVRCLHLVHRAQALGSAEALTESRAELQQARKLAESAWLGQKRAMYYVLAAEASQWAAERQSAKAEAAARKALELAKTSLEQAIAPTQLAKILGLSNRPDEALATIEKALPLIPKGVQKLELQYTKGAILADANRPREAEPILQLTLEALQSLQGPVPRTVESATLQALTIVALSKGDLAEAARCAERRIALQPKTDVGSLASLKIDLKEYVAAEELCRQAISVHAGNPEPLPESHGMALNNLAEALRFQGKLQEAEQTAREALKILEAERELPQVGFSGAAHSTLARALAAQGKWEEAADLYEESATRKRANHKLIDQLEETLDEFAIVCEHLNQREKARDLREEAERVRRSNALARS